MKRLLEILISLIVTAAFFTVFHFVFLFGWIDFGRTVPVYVPTVMATVLGLIFYFLFSAVLAQFLLEKLAQTEAALTKMTLKELGMGVIGCLVGLAIANLIGIAFNALGTIGIGVTVLLNLVLGILGFRVARQKKDEVQVVGIKNMLGESKKRAVSYGKPKVLDTSVIIDGRIVDLLETGFIEGTLIIPNFILDELRHIADSSDSLKRNRGRRGLDILNEIQKQLSVPVEIRDFHTKERMEVDSKLLKMAQEIDACVVTNDFNLNKVAEFQGVSVLNINELANAIKPVVLPGEEMKVTVIKAGKESGQGVAYLNDGTMIVVDGGSKHIGETMTVQVTSVLQTAAGRMIFTKISAVA